MKSLRTRRATEDELAAVKHWITKGYGGESCVTGVLVSETDDEIVVRMYSAMCVHDLYRIDPATVVRVEDSPRRMSLTFPAGDSESGSSRPHRPTHPWAST